MTLEHSGDAASDRPGPRRWRSGLAIATTLAPVALVVVAEAAWISVVGGLLQEFALRDPILHIPALGAFVAAGIVLARVLQPRLGERWPALALGLVVGAGAIGWLISGAARDALVEGLGPALAAHPGGWLAGLALLRGFAHARFPLAEETVTHLLVIGIPGLAFCAAIGGMIGEPYRARFLADALSAAVVYVGASVLALAFVRLDAIGLDADFDWRRNPMWLLMTVAMIGVAILVAIPLASMAGTILAVVISLALGPMLVLGLATGFDRTARRILLFFGAIALVLILLGRGIITIAEFAINGAPAGAQTPPSQATEDLILIGLGGFVLLAAAVGMLAVIAIWMRRTPPPDGSLAETRTIDPSGEGLLPGRRRGRWSRRRDPLTAVEAYVALIDDLARHPVVRRGSSETPAIHAARLRERGAASLSLDLLAADYALARYGGVDLPAREDRRGVGRWRTLRKGLAAWDRRHPVSQKGSATAPDAELPLDLEPPRTF